MVIRFRIKVATTNIRVTYVYVKQLYSSKVQSNVSELV